MEEASKCMVAIIEGAHDAGISVTVVKDWPEQNITKIIANNSSHHPDEENTSVQTSTDLLKKCHTISQISDGHFASSYQTAHRGVRPTSPPVHLSEFPPQRTNPHIEIGNTWKYTIIRYDIVALHHFAGQGSFEIGGTAAQDYPWPPQISYSRDSPSPDRGTLENGSHENDAFAHSLRKYSNVPPRTLSAELINRLLTYTQAKNLTRSSYHTKVKHSATDKNAGADKETRTNSSKNIQTYARTKRSCKENGNTTDKDITFGENTTNAKGLSHNNKLVRSRDSNINFIYDYLKSPKALRRVTRRSTDVRYLTDMKKFIRDTVRQMCEERPVVCPRIKSRYSNHRREYHRTGVEQESNCSCNARQDRASSPLTTEVSMMTQYEGPSSNNQTCSAEVNLCCNRKQYSPCSSCKPSSSKNISTKVSVKCACVGNNSNLKDKIIKQVNDWIKSIPVYANEGKRDKTKRDNMVTELTEVLEKAVTDGDFEIVKKEVNKFLDNIPMWCPDDDSEREIFKNQIAEKLTEALSYCTDKNGFIDIIADWVKNITFKAGNGNALNEADLVREIGKRIKSVKRSSNDDDYKGALISVINNVLEDLPIETDSSKNNTIYHLANKLANKFIRVDSNTINSELTNTDEIVGKDLEQPIMEEIVSIFDKTDLNLTITRKKNLQDKIAKLLSNDVQTGITNNTKKGIIGLLEKEAGIQGPEADNLANHIINKVKVMCSCHRKKISGLMSSSTELKNNIKESIKEEVNDILNTFKVNIDNRKTLEESISNIFEDEILRGGNSDKVRQEIYSLLYEANISDDVSKNISDKLTSRAREMSLCYKTKDSTIGLSTVGQLHENSFKTNVTQVVLEFVKNLDGNGDQKLKARVKEMSDNFIDNVAKIMLHSDYDKNTLFKEILIYIDNLPIKPRTHKEELAGQLMNSLQNMKIHTSTPHKEKISFRPQRDSTGSTISSIHFEDVSNTKFPISPNEEDKYNDRLTKILVDWVNKLPVDFNMTDAEGFRETMINDLVADIIDRQKYLQLNPVAKVSNEDELEHLKYQVFRLLNRLPNIEDLTDIMVGTESLMNSINNVQVPMLVKPISHRQNIKLREGQIPTYMDALQDEISIWLSELPKDLDLPLNKSHANIVTAELAEKIQEVNNTADIEDEIRNSLSKIAKNMNQSKLNKITQNLIDRLKNKGFTDEANWITVQNTDQFIEENLNGALIDWLKNLPLYKTRNSQERFVQEKIVTDLAKDMGRVFDNLQSMSSNMDSDKLLIDKILKHLKRFPMEKEKKIDENYIKSIAQHLLDFLKGLQIFQDISFRRLTPSNENLESNINDWMQSLPIAPTRNSTEKSQLEEITTKFKAKLKQLKQDHVNNQTILDETLKYLKLLPIDTSKKNNERYLTDKAQELFNRLENGTLNYHESTRIEEFEDLTSNIESSFAPEEGFKKAADILYENIESWCEKLPISGDDIEEEKDRIKAIKQNIASKLINIVGNLNMDPEIFYDDLIYDDLLKDEIDNMFSILPINKELENGSEILKLNLFNKIKEARDKIKNELAGHLYKQQLKDIISKTLPTNESVTSDDEAFFQTIRENVADAFINLHYFGAKQELRSKYRSKINEQINEFCSKYLKRYPATPIDSSKLNRELYIALKNVPMPTEESIRYEVEETRIKDEIHDWIKELPLRTQTVQDKQYTNKIASIMSKRLNDMEKNKKLIPNYTERLKVEILKWIKKIPLKSEEEHGTERFAEKLIDNLKHTEESRRFNTSLIRHSDEDLTDSLTTSEKYSNSQSFTRSSLTPNDHALLQHIRERTTSRKIIKNRPKDASVRLHDIDTESQTELTHSDNSTTEFDVQQTPSMYKTTQVDKASEMSSNRTRGERKQFQYRPCSNGKQNTIKPQSGLSTSPENRLEISPRVIVKEYHWDSTQDSSSPYHTQPCVDPSGLRQSSFEQQLNSSSIPPAPCPNTCTSTQTTRYLPTWRQPEGERIITKRVDPTFDEGNSGQASTIPRNTFRHSRSPTLGSLDAAQDSAPQRTDTEGLSGHDTYDFWRTPRRRHVVLSQEDIGRQCTIEGERNDEQATCMCRDRVMAKCSARNRGPSCQNHDSVKQCSRCCGTHCPYPSYLYFR